MPPIFRRKSRPLIDHCLPILLLAFHALIERSGIETF
jgi:hypothetical protein